MPDAELSTSPPEQIDELSVPQRRLLLFDIGGKIFACDMSAIREIIPFQRITRLPGAPPTVCGLTNLRGTIVTVLDLGARVVNKPCNREGGSILLVPWRDKLVGIGVDEVRDLQSVRADEMDKEGDLSAFDSGIILGLADVDGELAVILDINAIVTDVLGRAPGVLGGGES
jgi:purine-binding chemotaxis protein CheW